MKPILIRRSSINYRMNNYQMINCLILIQEITNFIGGGKLSSYYSDTFLLKTAAKKYMIGIGHKMHKYFVLNNLYEIENPLTRKLYHPYKASYPFIQVEPNKNFASLKCPTISGGQWLNSAYDFDRCHEKAPKIKGQTLNLVIRYTSFAICMHM